MNERTRQPHHKNLIHLLDELVRYAGHVAQPHDLVMCKSQKRAHIPGWIDQDTIRCAPPSPTIACQPTSKAACEPGAGSTIFEVSRKLSQEWAVEPRDASDTTFFTICNEPYFPGLIGLINSLRLVGHHHPIVVADCGLTSWQREVLKPHCTLFDLPSNAIKNPMQYKPFAHLLNPKGTVVLIDSDMIVTKNLSGILATAAEGKICVFPDPEDERWFAEWEEIFGVGPPRRFQTYACSGFVAFSTLRWPQLLEHWWNACASISTHPTYQEHAADGPTAQGDQDAFNALMMSEFPADALAFLPVEDQVFRWEFPAVQLRDTASLSCSYHGHPPAILHACLTPKPWQRNGVRRNAYVNLLRHLLNAPDTELQVPSQSLAVWLRRGFAADFACDALSLLNIMNPDDGILPKPVYSLIRTVKRNYRSVLRGAEGGGAAHAQ